jgi:hypothetical protein
VELPPDGRGFHYVASSGSAEPLVETPPYDADTDREENP